MRMSEYEFVGLGVEHVGNVVESLLTGNRSNGFIQMNTKRCHQLGLRILHLLNRLLFKGNILLEHLLQLRLALQKDGTWKILLSVEEVLILTVELVLNTLHLSIKGTAQGVHTHLYGGIFLH